MECWPGTGTIGCWGTMGCWVDTMVMWWGCRVSFWGVFWDITGMIWWCSQPPKEGYGCLITFWYHFRGVSTSELKLIQPGCPGWGGSFYRERERKRKRMREGKARGIGRRESKKGRERERECLFFKYFLIFHHLCFKKIKTHLSFGHCIWRFSGHILKWYLAFGSQPSWKSITTL